MYDVAVITPVFNTQEYLSRCVDSVLQQTDVSIQLFLIDDGSSDDSSKIAKKYQESDNRVTVISKHNEGQGIARNIGIKLANAKYVYFVDSDDYVGDDTLGKLFRGAEENNLDICSPGVPNHYFNKPLEYVPCLPCKSQFIKASILKEFGILQPDIRSGQDGVFSHLVLCHCERIGMLPEASFFYTHARDGSTFAAHLKKHHLVPELIQKHYAAILNHYDKFNLWSKNSLRLLWFIADESLRNRLEPHLPYLNDVQKTAAFTTLSMVAQRALAHVDLNSKDVVVHPSVIKIATTKVEELVKSYQGSKEGEPDKPDYPKGKNIDKKNLFICKFNSDQFSPDLKKPNEEHKTHDVGRLNSQHFNELKWDMRLIRGKVDLVMNSINNASMQIASTIYNPVSSTKSGVRGLIASATTLPHRLPMVHFAIESILAQTVKPEKIVLWVTDKINEQMITPELKALKKRGLLIKKVPDVGPHTKLMYALKEYSQHSIVTFDDDIVYPNNMIQALWTQHAKHPKAIICNWGRELAFDANQNVLGIREGKLLTPPTLELEIEQPNRFEGVPNLLAFPYGTSGVLYPSGSLHPRVFDVAAFKRLCPKEDDIWFKAMGILNRTPVIVTNLGVNPMHHCLTGTQQEALRHDNHGEGGNKAQMQRVFDELGLYNILAGDGTQ
ncbi:MAG: hypothetical protein Alis3KO_25750 [Aliiglaciecola sp.]